MVEVSTKIGFVNDIMSRSVWHKGDKIFFTADGSQLLISDYMCTYIYRNGEKIDLSTEYRDYVLDAYSTESDEKRLAGYCEGALPVLHFELGRLTAERDMAEGLQRYEAEEKLNNLKLQTERVYRTLGRESEIEM